MTYTQARLIVLAHDQYGRETACRAAAYLLTLIDLPSDEFELAEDVLRMKRRVS